MNVNTLIKTLAAFALGCFVVLCLIAWTPTTGSSSSGDVVSDPSQAVVTRTLTCIADASGDFVGPVDLFGQLLFYSVDPVSATTGYDISAARADATSIFADTNLSATATTSAMVADATRPMGEPMAGTITFTGADMGNAGETILRLIIKVR